MAFKLSEDINFLETQRPKLLPIVQKPRDRGKKTLVLDLDETLIHSSFQPVPDADFKIVCSLNNVTCHVDIRIRPFAEEFIRQLAPYYEIILFTASMQDYAEPIYRKLDPANLTSFMLFRQHCTETQGMLVKDLKRLNRPMSDVIIVDNSPHAFYFQPENSLPSVSWYDDRTDNQLQDFLLLLTLLSEVKDVRVGLKTFVFEERLTLKEKLALQQ